MLIAWPQSGIDFAIERDESTDIANCSCQIRVAKWYDGKLATLSKFDIVYKCLKCIYCIRRVSCAVWIKLEKLQRDCTWCDSEYDRKNRFLNTADSNAIWNHFCIHRQALVSKERSVNIKEVLVESVVNIVNFILTIVFLRISLQVKRAYH